MLGVWRSRAGLGLLVLGMLGLVALAGPVAAALDAAHSSCPGMSAAAGSHASETSEPAPARRCQWLTPTACCDEATTASAAPVYAPVLAVHRLESARPASPPPARLLAHPPEVPSGTRDALATVVLRV